MVYTFSLRYMVRPSLVFGSMPRTANSTSRLGLRWCNLLGGHFPKAPGVPGMPAIALLRPFPARQDNLVGIHDDDVIARIDVGRINRLVLATKKLRHLAGEPAQDFVLGVNDVPVMCDVFLTNGGLSA